MMKLSKLITTLSLLLIGVILAGTPAKATAGPPYVDEWPIQYWAGRMEECVSMDHMGLTQQYEDCIAGMAHDMITSGQIALCTIGLAATFSGIWGAGSAGYQLMQRLLATTGVVGGLVCGRYYGDWFGF